MRHDQRAASSQRLRCKESDFPGSRESHTSGPPISPRVRAGWHVLVETYLGVADTSSHHRAASGCSTARADSGASVAVSRCVDIEE